MIDNAEVLRILTEARSLIAKPWAWFKGDFHYVRAVQTKTGKTQVDCYCALGAMRQAAGLPLRGRHGNNRPAYLHAVAVLEDVVARPVANWNDSKQTTKKDVLAAFDASINLVKEQINNG